MTKQWIPSHNQVPDHPDWYFGVMTHGADGWTGSAYPAEGAAKVTIYDAPSRPELVKRLARCVAVVKEGTALMPESAKGAGQGG